MTNWQSRRPLWQFRQMMIHLANATIHPAHAPLHHRWCKHHLRQHLRHLLPSPVHTVNVPWRSLGQYPFQTATRRQQRLWRAGRCAGTLQWLHGAFSTWYLLYLFKFYILFSVILEATNIIAIIYAITLRRINVPNIYVVYAPCHIAH